DGTDHTYTLLATASACSATSKAGCWSSSRRQAELFRHLAGGGCRPGTRAMRRWRQLVVAPVARIAGLAGLGGLDDVVHLARGDVVQHVVGAVVVRALQVRVHALGRLAQQGVHVALLGAVGMHLDEDPLGP